MKILVVDDEPDIGEALEMALSLDGHAVSIAHSREAALELIDTAEPEAILLDFRMPGMKAEEFLARLRVKNLQAPVVLMTGADDSEEQAAALGLKHTLKKPFELEELARVLGALKQPAE